MATRKWNRRTFLQFTGVAGAAYAANVFGRMLPPSSPQARPMRVGGGGGATTQAIVGDVVDWNVTSGDWPGAFGHVTFRVHRALHEGNNVYYIRTDASNPTFAEREQLVHVPLLNSARGQGINNDLYLFDNGQSPVIRYAPGDDRYTPLYEINRVKGAGRRLESAREIDEARETGAIEVTATGTMVNYPLVKWADGGLTVDEDKAEYLGGGQLIEPVDTSGGRAVLKLHEAFPGSFYILTDASLAGPAGNMNVPVAASLWELNEHRATDKVWVFVNGVPGPGAMGFQPAVFGFPAGHPAWSPYWDHYALRWENEDEARLLTSSDEIRELRDGGKLHEFNGVPPTDPQGFVVNCSVPVTGENLFSA